MTTQAQDHKGEAKATPGRPRDDRIDHVVLRETLHELRISGLTNLNITNIAKRAGVAKATVYLRWPERKQLILDALLSTKTRVPRPDTGDLRGDLRLTIRRWADIYRDPDLAYIFDRLAAERADFSEIADAYAKHASLPANRIIEEVLIAGKERGEVRPDVNTKTAARALVGALMVQTRLEHRITPHFEKSLLDFMLGAVQSEKTP